MSICAHGSRLRRLAIPAFGLIGVWLVAITVTAVWDVHWFWRDRLKISRCVHGFTVLVARASGVRLHRRRLGGDQAAGFGIVDIVRFRYDTWWFGLFNGVRLGLCHQLVFTAHRQRPAARTGRCCSGRSASPAVGSGITWLDGRRAR